MGRKRGQRGGARARKQKAKRDARCAAYGESRWVATPTCTDVRIHKAAHSVEGFGFRVACAKARRKLTGPDGIDRVVKTADGALVRGADGALRIDYMGPSVSTRLRSRGKDTIVDNRVVFVPYGVVGPGCDTEKGKREPVDKPLSSDALRPPEVYGDANDALSVWVALQDDIASAAQVVEAIPLRRWIV